MTFEFLRPKKTDGKVRFGRNKDGGYVLEDNSLNCVDVIYSYGVGWEVSFEKALSRRVNRTVRMFDPTMFDWSNIPKHFREGWFEISKYVAKVVYFKTYLFLLPFLGYRTRFYNEGIAITKQVKYNTFANHLRRFGEENARVLLKIDIEGGEYDLFCDESFLGSLDKVVQIAIEFHDLERRIVDFRSILEVLSKQFSVVHLHANNYGGVFQNSGTLVPGTVELTLISNSYLKTQVPDTTPLPIRGLDYPNDKTADDIDLSSLFADNAK
jgi:hypothetical protein